ncbi:MAG: hypothetical protein K2M46_00135 [Lachnospiraceae bacterium]|nr:hypothetical protein [Lachnospiraceae bacterium]
MEIKKIHFKEKDDVKPQEVWDSWWEKCNYDCTEWRLKTLGDKYLNSNSPCYQTKTAKSTIWT